MEGKTAVQQVEDELRAYHQAEARALPADTRLWERLAEQLESPQGLPDGHRRALLGPWEPLRADWHDVGTRWKRPGNSVEYVELLDRDAVASLHARLDGRRDERVARLVQAAAGQRRRLAAILLAAAFVLVATASIAVASSPELRQRLGNAVTIATSASGQHTLAPALSFVVLEPTYLPDGLFLVAEAYNPAASSVAASAARLGGEIDPSVQRSASQRARELMAGSREQSLVLVFAADARRVVELVQRPASGKSLPAGDPVAVGQDSGVFTREGDREVLRFISGGTLVELYTTLDRAEALRVADGLRPAALEQLPAGFAVGTDNRVTEKRTPSPVPSPAIGRAISVERPKIDPQAVAATCGLWPYGASPTEGFERALCIARAVAGIDPTDESSLRGWGISQYRWREAASRLSVDPALGPDGDTAVWLVGLEQMSGDTKVVVLDPRTGEPYLLVGLKAVR